MATLPRIDPSDLEGLEDVVSVERDANADANPGGRVDFSPVPVDGLGAMKVRIWKPKPAPGVAQQQVPGERYRMLTLLALYPMLLDDVRLGRAYRLVWNNPNDGGRPWHLYFDGLPENQRNYYLAANLWGVAGG